MSDERLPDWLQAEFQRYAGDLAQGLNAKRTERWRNLRAAIWRFVREQRAEVYERCAAAVEEQPIHSDFALGHLDGATKMAAKLRSLAAEEAK